MVIIGFDPGLAHTGYAVLNKKGNLVELNKNLINIDSPSLLPNNGDDLS